MSNPCRRRDEMAGMSMVDGTGGEESYARKEYKRITAAAQ